MAYPYLQDLLKALFGVSLPLPIPMFGLLVTFAIFCSYWYLNREAKKMEAIHFLPSPFSPKISDFAFYTVVAGMLGARLFHILEYPHEFSQDPWGMIFSRGGFTVIGGLLLGTIAGVIYLKKQKIPVLPIADAAAPSMMLGYAVGRIGCQLAGDGDWGIVSNLSLKPSWIPVWLWAYPYTNNVIGEHLPDPGVYPTPLYESFVSFLLFFTLIYLRKKWYTTPGLTFSIYLILSGVERFFIELIRVNSHYYFLGLSFTQAEFLSVISVFVGITGLIYFSSLKKT